MIIRRIKSPHELDLVYRLVHDEFVRQGYIRPRLDRRLVHYAHLDSIPETSVLVAEVDGRIVGTNSITFDGPHGLHVDSDFKETCDDLRQREGRTICASWRIVTHHEFQSERRIVMGLIQKTISHALRQSCFTCVFTFHPRHERVYRKLLNMQTLARCEHTSGLQNAPAVFMRLGFEDLPPRWVESCRLRVLQKKMIGASEVQPLSA